MKLLILAILAFVMLVLASPTTQATTQPTNQVFTSAVPIQGSSYPFQPAVGANVLQ